MSTSTLSENLETVRALAPDLRVSGTYPRSPREQLGGYVLAARAVDKCRADLVGQIGEYHTNCPLDKIWLKFAHIDYDELRAYLATGAADSEVEDWIAEHGRKHSRSDIIRWNNEQRDTNLSDLPMELQEHLEDYIAENVPPGRVVYRFLDIFDLEERRL